MVISMIYTILIPAFLSAMTGYVSTNIAWIDMDNTNNLVPVSELVEASDGFITSINNKTVNKTCTNELNSQISGIKRFERNREDSCELGH
jgi:hypothetical protein